MDVTEAMIYCYEEPEMVSALMDKVTEFPTYCSAYKQVGGTAWCWPMPLAGLRPLPWRRSFAPYVKKIVRQSRVTTSVVYHNRQCRHPDDRPIPDTAPPCSTSQCHLHEGNASTHSRRDKIAMGNVDPARQGTGTPASVREETFGSWASAAITPTSSSPPAAMCLPCSGANIDALPGRGRVPTRTSKNSSYKHCRRAVCAAGSFPVFRPGRTSTAAFARQAGALSPSPVLGVQGPFRRVQKRVADRCGHSAAPFRPEP
ncbi:MAG: uroporphyrinogen decarboxylase family protein [Dysosmobacter welbionis]